MLFTLCNFNRYHSKNIVSYIYVYFKHEKNHNSFSLNCVLLTYKIWNPTCIQIIFCYLNLNVGEHCEPEASEEISTENGANEEMRAENGANKKRSSEAGANEEMPSEGGGNEEIPSENNANEEVSTSKSIIS